MIAVLAPNWWAIGLRGVLGILFDLIALFLPGATMLSVVLVFAAYTLVDGVFGIVSAVRAARQHERWSFLVLEGIVDIAAAALPRCGRQSPCSPLCSWSPCGRSSPVAWRWRRRFASRWSMVAAGLSSVALSH
jgi:hypothetical protein